LFTPDHRLLLDTVRNVTPNRLTIYEHIISPEIMEQILNHKFSELEKGEDTDLREFYHHYCRFFKEMTYDAVSFEAGIVDILPDSGAIFGGRPGPIQNREDYEKYPWQEIPERFWQAYDRHFEALCKCLPAGMKAVGGVGYGVFEISEDLVGYEQLSYMQVDTTATPKHNNGAIFVQTVVDYPLVEAISQNVVKHPVLPDAPSRAKLVERKSVKYTENMKIIFTWV